MNLSLLATIMLLCDTKNINSAIPIKPTIQSSTQSLFSCCFKTANPKILITGASRMIDSAAVYEKCGQPNNTSPAEKDWNKETQQIIPANHNILPITPCLGVMGRMLWLAGIIC